MARGPTDMCAVQAAIDPRTAGEHRSAWSTLQHVHRTVGLPSLWAGFAPRAFRIMCASVILQVSRCWTHLRHAPCQACSH